MFLTDNVQNCFLKQCLNGPPCTQYTCGISCKVFTLITFQTHVASYYSRTKEDYARLRDLCGLVDWTGDQKKRKKIWLIEMIHFLASKLLVDASENERCWAIIARAANDVCNDSQLMTVWVFAICKPLIIGALTKMKNTPRSSCLHGCSACSVEVSDSRKRSKRTPQKWLSWSAQVSVSRSLLISRFWAMFLLPASISLNETDSAFSSKRKSNLRQTKRSVDKLIKLLVKWLHLSDKPLI